jgi:hypothetical protein
MKIVPIEFQISTEDLTNLTTEDVENSIKEEIIKHIIETITPMLDDENFIDMTPSEDGSEFNIAMNIMVGASNQYIDAISATTANLMKHCLSTGVSQEDSTNIISKATQPLIELVY